MSVRVFYIRRTLKQECSKNASTEGRQLWLWSRTDGTFHIVHLGSKPPNSIRNVTLCMTILDSTLYFGNTSLFMRFICEASETVTSEDETVNSEVLVAPSILSSVIPSRGPSVRPHNGNTKHRWLIALVRYIFYQRSANRLKRRRSRRLASFALGREDSEPGSHRETFAQAWWQQGGSKRQIGWIGICIWEERWSAAMIVYHGG